MLKNALYLFLLLVTISCQNAPKETVEQDTKPSIPKAVEVASIKGQQLTGITRNQGRTFVNFPRWREQVFCSVAELTAQNEFTPYPNAQWNTWELDQPIKDSVFVAVQSVVASNNKLYVIDTRNPGFKGVIGNPIIFVFDLNNNKLIQKYTLPTESFHPTSYINDVRIDEQRKYAYFTDSGSPGLVLLNLKTGAAKRVLDQHNSTKSEVDYLTINQKQWNNTVHSDGIALDNQTGTLYYHALTGYHLYAVPVDSLIEGTAYK